MAGNQHTKKRQAVKYFLSLIAALLLIPGCAPRIAPGADPLVVRAEELAERASESMDAFVLWEYKNRPALNKDITAAADLVREFGPKYLTQLREATKLYKFSKTQPDADKVKSAMATLQLLLDQAREYYLKGG